MRLLVRALPMLLLCAGPAYAIDPNELPDGWWAPTLADCRNPEATSLFEIRLKARTGASFDSNDRLCRIVRVSDTAIGYRLDLRCYGSQADREADTNAATRQIVVDAIGPITMRADGKRVYRCAGRRPATVQAASPAAPDNATTSVAALAVLPPAEARPAVDAPAPAAPAAPGGVPIRHTALPAEPSPVPPVGPGVELPRSVSPASPVSLPPAGPARAVTRGKIVPFAGGHAPGTIVVRTRERALYLVQEDGTAIRYRVSVGRPGAAWSGVETVTAKQEWPHWTPTPEMRRRRPGLRAMRGGPSNPLGARALYLGSTAYRIHGTTEPGSIGRAASSGCIRMLNSDVIELYEHVPVGTRVEVL